MKKIGFAIVLAFISIVSSGQPRRADSKLSPQDRAELAAVHLKIDLKLTEDQTAKVKQVLLKKAETAEKDREILRKHMEESDKELAALLTPEQQDKFNKMRDERREKMKERRERHRRNPAPAEEPLK